MDIAFNHPFVGVKCEEHKIQDVYWLMIKDIFYATIIKPLTQGGGHCNFKSVLLISIYRIVAWKLSVKFLSDERHRALLIRNQHRFR